MKQIALLIAALSLLPPAAPGYSSAGNAGRLEPDLHLGYLAFGKPGATAAIKALPRPELADDLFTAAGIGHLRTFTIELDGRTLFFCHHTARNGANVGAAWNRARSNKVLGPWLQQWGGQIEPHPRASAEQPWLPLECVFYHRGPADRKPAAQGRSFAAITGLKPEKEMDYRTLHQTTWPGVLATMDKSNIANFTIYLFEIGEQLYLIYYFDYVGDDFETDMSFGGKDPVTLRWWKHTDACQLPLPDAAAAKKIWTDLVPVD